MTDQPSIWIHRARAGIGRPRAYEAVPVTDKVDVIAVAWAAVNPGVPLPPELGRCPPLNAGFKAGLSEAQRAAHEREYQMRREGR